MCQSGQLFYVGIPTAYCLPPMDPTLPHLPSYESVRKKDRQRQIHMMIADRFGLNGPATAEVRPFDQTCLRKHRSPLRWIRIIKALEFLPPCWPRVIAPVCSVIGLNDNGFCFGNHPRSAVMSMSRWRRRRQLLTCSVAMVFVSVGFDGRFVKSSMTWELHMSAWTNGGKKRPVKHNECWKVNSRRECGLLSLSILLPVTLSIGGPIRPLTSSLTECFPHSWSCA